MSSTTVGDENNWNRLESINKKFNLQQILASNGVSDPGWGVGVNPLKKGNFWQKPFFRKCWIKFQKVVEMISVDVKADVKQQEMKVLVAVYILQHCIYTNMEL